MPVNQPTLAQLRAFVALAGNLHFREAAAELGVSQPSVSAAISGLEACLGVELAQRSSRRVVLTPAGEQVAADARQVLADLDRLVQRAASGAGSRGPLRIGIIPTVAPYIIAPMLRALARRAPALRPEVSEEQTARLLAELSGGRLDALVVALPVGAGLGRLEEVPLYWEDFVLLVPPDHPLAGRAGVSRDVLKDLRLLLLEQGHCLSGQVVDICRQIGAATDHPARAASLTTIAQLVAAGLGATLLPETALPVETRKGKVAAARFRPPAPGRDIGLVFPSGSPRAAEYRQLAEYLRRGFDHPGFAGRVPGRVAGVEGV
ncbi:MAG: LysR substrate-binding domain-containing protein [Acidimicrobiales bacterium]